MPKKKRKKIIFRDSANAKRKFGGTRDNGTTSMGGLPPADEDRVIRGRKATREGILNTSFALNNQIIRRYDNILNLVYQKSESLEKLKASLYPKGIFAKIRTLLKKAETNIENEAIKNIISSRQNEIDAYEHIASERIAQAKEIDGIIREDMGIIDSLQGKDFRFHTELGKLNQRELKRCDEIKKRISYIDNRPLYIPTKDGILYKSLPYIRETRVETNAKIHTPPNAIDKIQAILKQ